MGRPTTPGSLPPRARSTILQRLWPALIFAACSGPAPDPEPAATDPAVVASLQEERGALLSDVQHLLGEAVAQHAAGQHAEAQQAWLLATSVFRDHLLPSIRAADRVAALKLEYDLGRLGQAVARPGGKPAALQKELDRALESHRERIVAGGQVSSQDVTQP